MINELLIYFGSTKDVADEFSNKLKSDIALPSYKWKGLVKAGDEDGTVWCVEYISELEMEEAEEVPITLIQDIAGAFDLQLASIHVDDYEDDDPVELFVNEDFDYNS